MSNSLDLDALEQRVAGWLDVKTASEIKQVFRRLRQLERVREAAQEVLAYAELDQTDFDIAGFDELRAALAAGEADSSVD